jgi:U3 small nucleolar ribonucleoprotein component
MSISENKMRLSLSISGKETETKSQISNKISRAIAIIRPMSKSAFCTLVVKGKRLKGRGKTQKPFPLSPYPFPDLCKKSIE